MSVEASEALECVMCDVIKIHYILGVSFPTSPLIPPL